MYRKFPVTIVRDIVHQIKNVRFLSMEADSGISCRICKSCSGNDLMKCPCLCKGSLGYVHFTCLELWLNQASRDYCELCQCRFNAVRSRRYGLIQSLCVWVGNPSHRTYLCYDLVIALILTALTAAIIFICLVGAGVFIREEAVGMEDPFVRGMVMLFMFILVTSYLTTLYLIVQDHIKPWYHWWRHCVNVKLVVDPTHVQFYRNPNVSKIQPVSTLPIVESRSRELLSLMHSGSSLSINKGNRVEKKKSMMEINKAMSNVCITHV